MFLHNFESLLHHTMRHGASVVELRPCCTADSAVFITHATLRQLLSEYCILLTLRKLTHNTVIVWDLSVKFKYQIIVANFLHSYFWYLSNSYSATVCNRSNQKIDICQKRKKITLFSMFGLCVWITEVRTPMLGECFSQDVNNLWFWLFCFYFVSLYWGD